jgi:hypothetical protein
VKLRLKRQLGVTVTKYVTKKVKVRKRVHGKIRRVTVKKRKPVKRRVTRCYYYSASANDFKALKSCKQDALLFKVNGGDYFQWEFTSPLPKGSYTLDAQAVDGVGNVDAAPELGRNRVTFSVK